MEKNNQFSLSRKVAVVTGASGDIGLAISNALGKAGAKLVLASRNANDLETAAKKLNLSSSNHQTVPTDVADIQQIESLMDTTVRKFGRLDILIAAAGIQHRMPAIEFNKDDWDRVLDVNLSGSFFCAQAAAKRMIKTLGPQQRGKIIFISSLTAEIGIPNIAAYAASRGAIRQISKALAVEWALQGINVNCIGPGRFRTQMTEDVFSNEAVSSSFLKLIPMGRPGIPTDLAGVSVFLASDASDYITGQSIYVDGGWLASGGNSVG